LARIRLTQAAVDKVRPPAKGRTEMFDTHLPGFALRVSASGHKSWVVFTRLAGRLRRFTVGTLVSIPKVEEARDQARALLRDVARGIDPADAADQEPPAAPVTVKQLAADFIERYAKPRNKSWHNTERVLALHVLPTLGSRPAVSIVRRDVRDLLDGLADRGQPIVANRTLAAVRKMLNWAVEREVLPVSPAAGVKAPGKETARERVLTDDELAAVWRGAEAMGGVPGAFVRLLILTGQRRNEVAGLRWSDLDLGKKVWTLPREMTKGNRSHEVPLSDAAVELITTLPRKGSFILTSAGFRRVPGKAAAEGRLTDRDRPISGYAKIKAKLDAKVAEILAKAAADRGEDAPDAGVEAWRFHDVRRTVGTGMARLGVPTSTISRVLNHKEGGVTRIYNRYGYLDEKRDALDRWARHVESLVRPAPDNVVEMRRA